jgi:hypothetical protein
VKAAASDNAARNTVTVDLMIALVHTVEPSVNQLMGYVLGQA